MGEIKEYYGEQDDAWMFYDKVAQDSEAAYLATVEKEMQEAEEKEARDRETNAMLEFCRNYQGTAPFMSAMRDKALYGGSFSTKMWQTIRNCMKSDDAGAEAGGVSEGFWVVELPNDEFEYYKVQRAVHGSGELYGKKLAHTGTFEYLQGCLAHLKTKNARKLTLEEAKSLGRLYGQINYAPLVEDGAPVSESATNDKEVTRS